MTLNSQKKKLFFQVWAICSTALYRRPKIVTRSTWLLYAVHTTWRTCNTYRTAWTPWKSTCSHGAATLKRHRLCIETCLTHWQWLMIRKTRWKWWRSSWAHTARISTHLLPSQRKTPTSMRIRDFFFELFRDFFLTLAKMHRLLHQRYKYVCFWQSTGIRANQESSRWIDPQCKRPRYISNFSFMLQKKNYFIQAFDGFRVWKVTAVHRVLCGK